MEKEDVKALEKIETREKTKRRPYQNTFDI